MVKESREDKVFNGISTSVLLFVSFICIFPLLFVLSVSLTPITEVFKNGGFILIPKKITLSAFSQLMSDSYMPNAFMVTLFVTLIGTSFNMLLTTLLAYPLSRSDLPGRRYILLYVLFTMLFNGGLIPTYLIVKQTGLLNTLWSLIIPSAVAAYNTMIMKGFFENMPNELYESARIDGAGEWTILLKIVLPLSKPVMASVGLFYAVSHWNSFMPAILYISDPLKKPMQVVVRDILSATNSIDVALEEPVPTQTMQMAAVVFSSLPIILIYPFLQKYFVKGVMIGAVKG